MMIYLIVLYCAALVIVHSYVFYPIILLLIPKNKTLRKDSPLPESVSVIIAAYNEEKVIRRRIENLLALKYPLERMQILIGSDCSSDNTESIVREFEQKGVTLVTFKQRRGKAAVLNDLVSIAHNEILIFSDANTFYSEDAVTEMLKHYSSVRTGGVCGYLKLLASDDNSGGKSESIYWEYENRIKELEGDILTTFGATGAIYSIRRSLFVPLPMDKAVTDDLLIPMYVVSQGYRMIYYKKVHGWERATDSAITEYHRKVRIGASNFNSLSYILREMKIKNHFVLFGFVSHKLFRWIVPFCLIALFGTSIILADGSEMIKWLMMLQMIFYGSSIVGKILDVLGRPVKIFTLPYYFVLANLGLFMGFVRFIKGSQRPAWNATR